MRLSILLLVAPLAGALAVPSQAQERGDAERVQQAREKKKAQEEQRAQEAREKKKAQDEQRAKEAREKKAQADKRRAEAARDAKGQQGAKPGVKAQRAPDARAQGVSGTDQDRAKAAREKEQRTKEAREKDTAQREAERAAKARGDQQRTAAARQAAAKQRQIISDMTRRVRDHRVRLAELARLESLFAEKGERDKVARVQALRKKENQNFTAILKRYEGELGAQQFGRVTQRLRLEGAK